MREVLCIQCNKIFLTDSKRKDKRKCNDCLKYNKYIQVMTARKKRIPTTEIGVGSGKSSTNLNREITQYTYQKVRKEYCELCNSTINLCVHHIDGNRNNNDLSNLITVCKKCHQQHHVIRDEFGRFKQHEAK